MADDLSSGKPIWLSAYPNEGTLDYFGFRFYRQPQRYFLIRGAAANDFKNAKTLLFYAALAYSFRIQNGIPELDELTENEALAWKLWYQSGNYLYILHHYARHATVPDRGFTGAIEEYMNHAHVLFDGTVEEYDLESCFTRIYPPQREWGYLSQFWRPPLYYFRSVLDIPSCSIGEYARECYNLLSSYRGWEDFISILSTRKVNPNQISRIDSILESGELTPDEQNLAQAIIFDRKNVTSGENDEYKAAYNLLHDLKEGGYNGFTPKDKYDIAMLFCYGHLTNAKLGQNDLPWKILISSITFEIGINRLFTLIARAAPFGSISKSNILATVDKEVDTWILEHGMEGSLAEVIYQWRENYLKEIQDYKALFNRMLNYKEVNCSIDGLLQGYLVYQSDMPLEIKNSEMYRRLTDDYHHFVPQPFFNNKRIDPDMPFRDFIRNMTTWLIDDQYEFSLERMNYGQKAKFVLTYSEINDQYNFQVDAKEFYENRGIIEMIDACLNLWRTAGIYSEV